MKTFRYKLLNTLSAIALICLPCLTTSACSEKEITRPEVTDPLMPDQVPTETLEINMSSSTQTVAFNSGSDGINSFRIPTIVTAQDGSLIVACEGRRTTWSDKSETNVMVKRSTDGGKTWSAMTNITGAINSSANYAFMDPTLIVEKSSGKIWMFCCRWPKSAANTLSNRAFMSTSTNNGTTWSTPIDVTDEIVASGYKISGFGPGSGFQIKEGTYANRLIVPTRQTIVADGVTTTLCYTLYSDDKGVKWNLGTGIKPSGESQMADCGGNTLTINLRAANGRRAGFSIDGGKTWSTPSFAEAGGLPGISGGCQASVLGVGETKVLFCGIVGGTATPTVDDRCKLAIYRSVDGAKSWNINHLLYEKAAGYCCITELNDGRIAIVFEAGDGEGFTKISSRPAGWMRLDVIVLPKEVTDSKYWFKK